MPYIEKTFGLNNAYKVSLDPNMGDGATGCWIEFKGASASLQCLSDFGYIEDDKSGEQHKVRQAVIDEIEEWALENGY